MFDFSKELYNITVSQYRAAIEEIWKNENITTNAELILALCKIITTQIDIVV